MVALQKSVRFLTLVGRVGRDICRKVTKSKKNTTRLTLEFEISSAFLWLSVRKRSIHFEQWVTVLLWTFPEINVQIFNGDIGTRILTAPPRNFQKTRRSETARNLHFDTILTRLAKKKKEKCHPKKLEQHLHDPHVYTTHDPPGPPFKIKIPTWTRPNLILRGGSGEDSRKPRSRCPCEKFVRLFPEKFIIKWNPNSAPASENCSAVSEIYLKHQ